jgi:hypothetical protein
MYLSLWQPKKHTAGHLHSTGAVYRTPHTHTHTKCCFAVYDEFGRFRVLDDVGVYDEFGRVYNLGFWTMLGVYDEFGRFRV